MSLIIYNNVARNLRRLTCPNDLSPVLKCPCSAQLPRTNSSSPMRDRHRHHVFSRYETYIWNQVRSCITWSYHISSLSVAVTWYPSLPVNTVIDFDKSIKTLVYCRNAGINHQLNCLALYCKEKQMWIGLRYLIRNMPMRLGCSCTLCGCNIGPVRIACCTAVSKNMHLVARDNTNVIFHGRQAAPSTFSMKHCANIRVSRNFWKSLELLSSSKYYWTKG